MDKKFWATTLTLSGTMIGAGILGMPYIFSKSGFLPGVFWVVFLGLIILYVNLCLGEITLRTKEKHQIPGYAEIYLGKWGKNLMFFAMLFGIYSALLAYLVGEGQSFSILFFGNFDYSVYFAVGFWFVMTLFLSDGIDGLKKIEYRGVLFVAALIAFLLAFFARDVNLGNLTYTDWGNFFVPFGIVLFAMLGFSSVPEMRIEIERKEGLLKKAIIFGTLVPMALYIIFTFIFLGVFGKNVSEVATLSSDSFIPAIGIFTMLSTYFVLSFSLMNVFVYDFRKKNNARAYVALVPIALYFLVEILNFASFATILGIGGVVSGGLTIFLVLLIHMRAKKRGNRKPEYSVPMNWLILGILGLIFLAGIVFELGRF